MHYLFVDLDDTLFQSSRKCAAEERLLPFAHSPDGAPNGFMTQRQQNAFSLLSSTMTMIPVTARDLNAFQRVRIGVTPYAIIDFGAVILDTYGRPDEVWLNRSRAKVKEASGWMESLKSEIYDLIRSAQLNAICRMINDFETPFYLVVKYREGDEGALNRIRLEVVDKWVLEHPGLAVVHINGNNLAVLPVGLDKRHAVRHLQERLRRDGENVITWGMGDSLSDLGFMSCCDYSIFPTKTQIGQYLAEGFCV
jgi:hydroxymethylpyrimidine pyrophosphatase-like HAD family hydrolase